MQPGQGERRLQRLGKDAWALLGVLLLAAAAWWLVDQLSGVVVPLTLALFPAAILTPPARLLERRGMGRTTSTVVVVLAATLVVAGTVGLLVVQVQGQVADLADQAAQGYERLRTQLGNGAFGLPPIDVDAAIQEVRDGLTGSSQAGAEGEGEASTSVMRALSSSATLLAQFAFALVAMFLYVRDGDRMAAWFRQLFPVRWRAQVKDIGADVGNTLGGYIRGQATVAAIDAVFIGLGLFVLGVPLALSLTVLTFVAAFVPIVGAFASGAAAALVALAAGGFGDAMIVVGLVVLVQQLEGNILQPWILGNRVEMHPLGVITALTLGGLLYGLVGAILAVPLAAAGYRVADRLVQAAREEQDEDPSARPTVVAEGQA